MIYFSHLRAGLISTALLLTTALASPALAENLPEISPRQIAGDVKVQYNPDNGAREYIAPTFDPFEEDKALAGTANLRSVSNAVAIDGQSLRGGALLDLTFYYSSPTSDPYDIRGFEEGVFLSGEYAPVTLRDNRVLDCSEQVTESIYHHDNYYSPSLYLNFYRPYRHYGGHYRFGHSRFGNRYGHAYRRAHRGYRGYRGSRHDGFRGRRNHDDDNTRRRRRNDDDRARDRRRDRDEDRTRDRRRRNDEDRTRDRRRDRNGDGARNRRGDGDRDARLTRRDRDGDRWVRGRGADGNVATSRTNRRDGRNNRNVRGDRTPRNNDAVTRSNRRNVTPDSRSNPRSRVNRNRNDRRNVGARTARPEVTDNGGAQQSRRNENRRARRNAAPNVAPAPRRQNRVPRAVTPNRSAPAARPAPAARSAPAPRPAPAARRAPPPKKAPAANRRNRTDRAVDRAFRRKNPSNTKRPSREFFPKASSWSRRAVTNVDTQCAREERLTVHIPQERLDASRFDGLTVLVLDRAGREIPVYIPPNYVEGFRLAAGGSVGANSSGTYSTSPETSPVYREPNPARTIEMAPCPTGTLKQPDGTCLTTSTTYGGYPER